MGEAYFFGDREEVGNNNRNYSPFHVARNAAGGVLGGEQRSQESRAQGHSTVYRVLTQFETAGLVQRHNFEGGSAVFELDDGAHHDHIVCLDCGRVEEFVDPMIEDRQKAMASEHGFDITSHSLIIYGACRRADCPYREDGSV